MIKTILGDDERSQRTVHPIHKLTKPDLHYDIQLLREIETINERTRNELGVLSPDRHAIHQKRKPNIPAGNNFHERMEDDEEQEEAMKIRSLAAATTVAVVSGCSSIGIMHRTDSPPRIEDGVLTIPFHEHDFASHCFDTLACRVLYENRYDSDEKKPSPHLTEAIRRNLGSGWILDSFPSVAEVEWTSMDGTHLRETIDLGKIFQSGLILYADDLDIDSVDLSIPGLPPEIFIVVEDRTIHVYMKAMIPLNKPINPDNKFSTWRFDSILAYKQSF